jgi:hypothetical protein
MLSEVLVQPLDVSHDKSKGLVRLVPETRDEVVQLEPILLGPLMTHLQRVSRTACTRSSFWIDLL